MTDEFEEDKAVKSNKENIPSTSESTEYNSKLKCVVHNFTESHTYTNVHENFNYVK